ncbi:MAG: diaminopimelate epimerase [Gemmataceae bacterium]
MRFVKMHGAGNDYVYVDCFRQVLPGDPASLARAMSHRHFGVGADGLILILPSERADARMRMFNADGSEAEMCGNGIRCVAKYLYDHGLVRREQIFVETARGVLALHVFPEDGRVRRVRVDMGEPILEASRIPTTLPGNPPVAVPLTWPDTVYDVTCLSMGNPHCVTFVSELTDELVHRIGPQLEHHPAFPQRTNVEFAKVIAADAVQVRVWERGTGETLACGTGACAVVVAGALSGKTRRSLTVHMPGGDLAVEWNASDNHVYLTGPAVEVFTGDWPDTGPS